MTLSNRLLRFMQTFTILGWKEVILPDGTTRMEHELMPLHLNTPQQMMWDKVAPFIDQGKRVWPIVLKARREGVCLDPDTRVLTDDLQWVPIGKIEGGQGLVSVGEQKRSGRGIGRRMCWSVAVAKSEVLEPAFLLLMDDGRRLVATAKHRFLSKKRGGTDTIWRSVGDTQVGDYIRWITQPWEDSSSGDMWFGGLLDGEGSLRPRNVGGVEVTITQVIGPVLDRARSYLEKCGYTFREEQDDRWVRTDGYNRQTIRRLVLTRMDELFRLIGQSRPTRFLSREWWEGKELPGKRSGLGWSAVVDIKPLGVKRMIDLQTTEGTFIAEGFVSHNSTLTQALIMAFGFYRGNGETLTLAHEGESSRAIFEIQRRIWTNMPLAKHSEPPQHEIRINSPTGSVLHRVSTAGAEAKGRGTSPIAEHLSEVAFWPFPETMTAVLNAMPAIPTFQDIVVIESTANGKSGRGELFYQEWRMAEQGISSKIPIFLSCLDLPDYQLPGVTVEDLDDDEIELRDQFHATPEQLAWYRFVLFDQCHGDPNLRRQEYPASPEQAFISSGMPAFDPHVIARQRVNLRKPDRVCTILSDGRLLDRPDGELRIWRHPDGTWPSKNHSYVCASDSAPGGVFEDTAKHGDTRSWTGDIIIDTESGAQVGEWYGPQVGRLHASTLYPIVSKVFPNALLTIELNSEGGRILQADMREHYHYTRLHPWKGKRDRVKPGAPHVYGWECIQPDARVLTSDLQWIPACKLEVGDSILAYKDHSIRKGARHLNRQTITEKKTFIADRMEVVLDNGQKTVVSTNHPFWVRRPGRPNSNDWNTWNWVTADNLRPGDVLCYIPVWEPLRTYDAGRLSAFLDGEGHLSRSCGKYGPQLLISQAEGPLAQEILELWGALGFDSIFKWLRHKKRPQEKPITTSGVIQITEVLRALGSLRPTRLLRKFAEMDLDGMTIKSFQRIPVHSVQPVGSGVVIGLTTDPDHTLIADGILGHNTNSYTRPMILDNAQYCLARDAVTIRSDRLLSQLADLTKSDTGRYEAEVGRDDLALSWMIALESWQENFRGKRFGYHEPEGEELERKLKGMGLRVVHDVDWALSDHVKKVMSGGGTRGRRYSFDRSSTVSRGLGRR